MTSEKLVEIIKNSTLKDDVHKKHLYDKYYPLIEATLTFCPDNFSLDDCSSLKGIACADDFENFIKSNDSEAIKVKFENILTDIKTLKQITQVRSVACDWLTDHSKKHFKRALIFLIGLGILAIAVVVLSVLETLNVIATRGIASCACGGLDFLFGVGFFIYEFISDRNVKTMNNDMEKAIEASVTVINQNISVSQDANAHFGIVNPQSNQSTRVVNKHIKVGKGATGFFGVYNGNTNAATEFLNKYKV